MIDIFRSLIEQTINQHEHAQNSQPWRLHEGHFENCKTEEDWQGLFVAAPGHLSNLVIVIDAYQDASGDVLAVINKLDAKRRHGCQSPRPHLWHRTRSRAGKFPYPPSHVHNWPFSSGIPRIQSAGGLTQNRTTVSAP